MVGPSAPVKAAVADLDVSDLGRVLVFLFRRENPTFFRRKNTDKGQRNTHDENKNTFKFK
jgi:hypothetical protein